MSELSQHRSINRHINGLALGYGAVTSALLLIQGDPQTGIVPLLLALLASLVLLVHFILPENEKPLMPLAAMILLGIGLLLATQKEPGVPIQVLFWSLIVSLSLRAKIAGAVVLSSMVWLYMVFDSAEAFSKVVMIICMAGTGAYLRWLLMKQHDSLEEQVKQDTQEGCRNAKALAADCAQYFRLFRRYGIPCSLLVIDANYSAKTVESQQALLNSAVSVWLSRIRKTDLLYRISDHRFVCLVTATEFDQACHLLDDLSKATEAYDLPGDGPFSVTIKGYDCASAKKYEQWLAPVYK